MYEAIVKLNQGDNTMGGWNENDYGPEETASTNEEVAILDRPDKPGPVLRGIYSYRKPKTGKMMGDLFVFHLEDGKAVGLWQSTTLATAMDRVPVGALCNIKYDGARDTGKGSPAHLWTVTFRAPKPGSQAAKPQGGGDDIRF